jgi:hypothetical protein
MGGKFLLFKMKNKKAQIPTTLTWFVAFIIIFFIIILFISASIIIAGKKEMSVLGMGSEIDVVQYGFEDLESQRSLISFLETPIEIDNKKEKIKDLILSSLDSYIEDETGVYFERFKIWDKSIMKKLEGDLNKLDALRPQISREFFVKNQASLKDDLVLTTSASILNEFCEDYMLKIPQGIIKKGEKDFLPENNFETLNWKEILLKNWSPRSEIKIPYKNQFIKIKYRQLKKC